jgi:exopolysaccharide biosynthesis protein
MARHPRTVLGWNDKSFFMVVVDGRQPGLSMGMTYPELAEMMLNFGCTEAVNIDGGGSSTFWLGGKIMNSPSDGRERSIANGLIVVQKKKDDKIKIK